ncbi:MULTISPECIES: glyoxalase/bleomycin resistance/extradiol dioxygenase family protein [unclassified Crossiella]|uniref:VOC family protein n=1 Tax=unclassified Crossiella TaxID=2620835 RepID=UPI001FFED34C|nr:MULTISPECIES: VOC family protein [unclassified Crossiella]MCK2239151.1 hypothetical protein [Crossiella sp. S99.2]MCK2251280.1 hypothetical protein [Crossiella sp. S99.1]
MSGLTPYVMVRSAKEFVQFITDTFDAEVSNVIPLQQDPERVVHAQARIGEGVLFFGDAGMDGRQCLPTPEESAHVQLWTVVPDPETTHAKALAAGAREALPVTKEEDGTLMSGFIDPFGTLWWLSATGL